MKRFLCFENDKYIVLTEINNVNDVLTGKEFISFPACGIWLFDKDGNEINTFIDGIDMREEILINEWHIEKISFNRIEKGKKINSFCECGLYLHDLGESEK